MEEKIRYIFSIIVAFLAITASAQQSVEELFQKGNDCGEKEQYVEAVGYWTQAAQMGYTQAQCVLGV